MADETTTTTKTPASKAGAEGEAAQPAAQPAAQTPAGSDRRVEMIPTATLGKIKRDEREKGRKAALAELDAAAKELGYADHATMIAKLKARKAAGAQQPKPQGNKPQQPAAQPPSDGDNREPQPTKAERRATSKLEEQYRNAQQRAIREEKRRRQLEREVRAKEAEVLLTKAAMECGVRDVDYALHLLYKEQAGKSDEELAKFDEKKFFLKLREKHPYIFGEQTVPATTGTGTETPAPPSAAQEAQKQAANGQVDAMKMKPDEYQVHLRKLGLNPERVG